MFRGCHQNFINVGVGVVDSDYRGEIKVVLFNHFAEDFVVQVGDRIAQLILERIKTPQVKKVAALDDTGRGAEGFGSMGTKQVTQSSPRKDKKGIKKKNPLSPSSRSRSWQAHNSVHMVVNAGPGPSSTSGMTRGSTDGQEVESPDSVPGGTTVEVGESMAGVDSQVELQNGELSSWQRGLAVDPYVFWWTLGRLATTLMLESAQHGE